MAEDCCFLFRLLFRVPAGSSPLSGICIFQLGRYHVIHSSERRSDDEPAHGCGGRCVRAIVHLRDSLGHFDKYKDSDEHRQFTYSLGQNGNDSAMAGHYNASKSARKAGDVPIGRFRLPVCWFDTFAKPFRIDLYSSRSAGLVWRIIHCRSGGIGRRAWFRSMYSQGCGGSSPFFGTSSKDFATAKNQESKTPGLTSIMCTVYTLMEAVRKLHARSPQKLRTRA